jgi:hypothetical protein
MVPRMVLGDVVSLLDFTWLLSLPTWGVDVDGLAYPLHHPTVHGSQMRNRASCLVLPCPIAPQWVVAPFCGVESPWDWIFDVMLTI